MEQDHPAPRCRDHWVTFGIFSQYSYESDDPS